MVYGTQESLPEIRLEIFYGRPVELNHKELLPKLIFISIFTHTLNEKAKIRTCFVLTFDCSKSP